MSLPEVINNDLEPPTPSQLQLIIITCKASLGCNINLQLMAKNLPLNEHITGKFLVDVVDEGNGISKNKNKSSHRKNSNKPPKKVSRKDFSNQCTVVVRIGDDSREINLKIFGNGKIVITGSLSKDCGKVAVQLLKKYTRDLMDTYQIRSDIKLTNLFDNVASYLKYINKNYLIFLKFCSIYNINVDLRLDLVLNKKFVSKYKEQSDEPCDPIKEGVLSSATDDDLDKYLRMIQVFNICHMYVTNEALLKQLTDTNDPIHHLIHDLFEFKPRTLPITFDLASFDQDFEVIVENYNTVFNSGFNHNRELFTQILNDKYKTNGTITSAKFEPTNYQGINVKYVSRVLCHPACTSTGKKKNTKCLCKEISFLIFQKGKIIITGGRFWEQLIDGYNVITNILKNEYQNIYVEKQIKRVTDQDLPRQISDVEEDGSKVMYLNISKQIAENPRNVYLLKQFGLLDDYLTS
jgi:TATA-box binding protein (TBP) (component of TFIID and TFIIIB)